MFISFFRVIKFGLQDFFRNFWLSFVTLTILFLALSSINALIILNAIADTAIQEVEDKIDITVYFKQNIREEQVLNVQNYMLSVDGVSEAEYISADDALINFRAKHQNDEKIIASVDELDVNPLGATLVIKANSTSEYKGIISTLEGDQYNNLIEDKDFEDHRLIIDRITNVTNRVSVAFMIIAIIFTLISILIVFNAIRVAIYTHRDEIKVMKLVGATDAFIVAPYIIEGIIFAFFAIVLTMFVVYPFLGVLQPYIETFFANGNLNLVQYYNDNFYMIFGLQFAGAALINVIAGLIATNRYLKG